LERTDEEGVRSAPRGGHARVPLQQAGQLNGSPVPSGDSWAAK